MKRLAYTSAALILLLIGVRWYFTERPVYFQDLGEAVGSIRVAGFHVTSDRIDGDITNGFLVTTQRASWKDANDLVKSGKIGPEWRGKVWVTIITEGGPYGLVPEDASTRTWGNICAFGDKDLLNQVERALQRVVQSST